MKNKYKTNDLEVVSTIWFLAEAGEHHLVHLGGNQ